MAGDTLQSTENGQMDGIRLNGFSLTIHGTPLFHELDHDFPAGEWTCLLGVSGVGKSMLLRSMLGLLSAQPQPGIVSNGHVTTGSGQPLGGACAYMAQQDLLMPWLSVRENVMLGGTLRDNRVADDQDLDRANALLDETALLNRADDLPGSLSGGMRQRVALARTLWEDRPIVLMDEPFSSLDAITRLHAQDLAARLLVGRTVVMVTHDPLEAIRLADHICVLSGTPARLSDPIRPSGQTPRPVDNKDVLAMQGALLAQLRGDIHA